MVSTRGRIVYSAAVIRSLPEPGVSQGCKNVMVQAAISGKVNGLAIRPSLTAQRAAQMSHLRRIFVEVGIHVRFDAGVFSDKA